MVWNKSLKLDTGNVKTRQKVLECQTLWENGLVLMMWDLRSSGSRFQLWLELNSASPCLILIIGTASWPVLCDLRGLLGAYFSRRSEMDFDIKPQSDFRLKIKGQLKWRGRSFLRDNSFTFRGLADTSALPVSTTNLIFRNWKVHRTAANHSCTDTPHKVSRRLVRLVREKPAVTQKVLQENLKAAGEQ